MKIHRSAHKHGVAEVDIRHAVEHRAYEGEPDDDMPAKQFLLGWDTHGRLLEIAILTFDSGNQLFIHAMKARRRFEDLAR